MSEETQLPPPQWRDWCSSLERLHAALATVCVLFAQREAPTTLRTLRAAVERMAQLPLDATTLRLLQRVQGADEIGLDALGDDDIAVKLRLEKPGGAKRKRPDADASTSQQRRQRAPFAAARKIKDVPGLLAALTAAFRARSLASPPSTAKATRRRRHCARRRRRRRRPLAAAAGRRAAAAADGWSDGDAVTAATLCGWLAAQPWYRGQLAHVHRSAAQPRAPSSWRRRARRAG